MNHSLQKRSFSMLEVMIAFVLILFCLAPLIYPNLAIFREQTRFVETIKIDHAVTLLHGDVLEKLHRREIPFESLTQKSEMQIPLFPEALKEAGLGATFPYDVTLTAQLVKMKGVEKGLYTVALTKLTYRFTEKGSEKSSPMEFVYQIPVVKLKPEIERVNENQT
jgi:hypothetical protein